MRRALLGFLVVFLTGLGASGVRAATWPPGSNPPSNYPVHIPQYCYGAPKGTKCLKAGLNYLNKARGHLHQRSYGVPGNFLKLPADQQVFILTDLDRAIYQEPMIDGVTAELNRDALAGVRNDADPEPGVPGFTSDPHFSYYGSNWAYGYPNVLFAYGSWMYDDGYGSNNLDCQTPHASGCWGHRHNILLELQKEYNITGPTAMGAAAGKDHSGNPSYAMMLGRGDSSYTPKFLIQWSDREHWW